MSTPSPYSPVIAPPHIHALLSTLHATSLAQEASIPPGAPWNSPADDPLMLDKFIALDPQKCQFVYLLARYALATHVVEVGTSFGLSTMYLALAVGQNVAARAKAEGEGVASGKGGKGGKVLATEKEPSKAGKAREHWRTAGETVEPWIELLEGDLLETVGPALARWEERVDLLLLDSMSEFPLVLVISRATCLTEYLSTSPFLSL